MKIDFYNNWKDCKKYIFTLNFLSICFYHLCSYNRFQIAFFGFEIWLIFENKEKEVEEKK